MKLWTVATYTRDKRQRLLGLSCVWLCQFYPGTQAQASLEQTVTSTLPMSAWTLWCTVHCARGGRLLYICPVLETTTTHSLLENYWFTLPPSLPFTQAPRHRPPSYNAGDIAGTAVLKQWLCCLMTKLSARFPVSGFFVLAVASSSSAASSYCSSCSISTPRPANQSSSANRGERANLHMRAELFELWVFGCLHHVSAARCVDFELFTSLLPLLVNMYLISASLRSIQERDGNTFVQQVFFRKG